MRYAPLLYPTADDWRDAPEKRVALFGMSGLGKTFLSSMLRETGGWFHYSVDYRIGTRYLGERIADSVKREAMKVPFLRDLLMSDSIYIGSNITFNNLAPLSTYLGKPGDPAHGGLSLSEYRRRQAEHDAAERAALLDTDRFIDRAQALYGYPHFVGDTGGSICEVVDPTDPGDPVLTALSARMLLVWIAGSDAHREDLIRRFEKAPKPMAYQPAFLSETWDGYVKATGLSETEVDPDAFIRHAYGRAMAHRQPRYAAMAEHWGVTVLAEDVAKVHDESGFVALIAAALERAADATYLQAPRAP
ncbi:MAG: ATPase [Pseudomonadota bacterium]